MSELLETINNISAFLWSIVGIIVAVILLWGLWQMAQIVRNMKEYGLDYTGFMRGELHLIAKNHNLEIMKPSQRQRRVHTIMWEGKDELDDAYKKTGKSGGKP
jgi:hypothetical protein